MKKILALSCISLMIVACAKNNSSQINNDSSQSGESTSSVYIKLPTNTAKNCRIKKPITNYSTSTVSSTSNETNDSDDVAVRSNKKDKIVKPTLDTNKNDVEIVKTEVNPSLEKTVIETNNNANVESTDMLSTDSSRSNVANISWQWPEKGNIIEKFTNASKGIDISGLLSDKVVIGDDGQIVYSGNDAAIRSTLLSVSIALNVISSKLPLGVTTIYKVIMSNHLNFS